MDFFDVYARTGKYKTHARGAVAGGQVGPRADAVRRAHGVPQRAVDEDIYMEMPEGYERAGAWCAS